MRRERTTGNYDARVDGSVVAEQDVKAHRDERDTAETRVTLSTPRLEQRVIRFETGRSRPRDAGEKQEILYVVSGRGSLHLGGGAYALEPEMGVFLLAGER